jgi:hypothetical protein
MKGIGVNIKEMGRILTNTFAMMVDVEEEGDGRCCYL